MKKMLTAGLMLALALAAAMPATAEDSIITIQAHVAANTTLTSFTAISNPGLWQVVGNSATFTPVAAWAGHHNHFGFAAVGNPPVAEPANSVYGAHVYNPASDNGFLTGSKGLPSFPDANNVTNMLTPDDWSHGIATLLSGDSGGTFRFVLDSMQGAVSTGLWTSVAGENSDLYGHLKAFATSDANTFLLAWEDLPNGGDLDHNDFVVLATGIRPVPEPGTLALLGTGVMGLLGYARRRKA